MVDINLMGDEENREEVQPEESLAQTVNLDLGDYAEEEKTEAFPREPMPGAYPREPMGNAYPRPSPMSAPAGGSSRNMAYLLVAILILLALVAVYLMIPRGADKSPSDAGELTQNDSLGQNLGGTENPIDTTMLSGSGNQSATENLGTTTEPVQPPVSSQPEPSPRVTENTESTRSSFPLVSSTFASTRIGAYTVGALGQAFGGADFSLISFSGNNNSFLVQFPPASDAAVTDITEAMRRNASPEDIRTVSKGNGTSNALVLGRVGERAAMMGPQSGQQQMSYSVFSAWVKKLAADNGLSTKLFDVSQPYSSGGATRTPVQANFSGDRAGVFSFLKNLADAGPNIVTSKIIVSPSDRRSQSSAQLDVVLLFDFVE